MGAAESKQLEQGIVTVSTGGTAAAAGGSSAGGSGSGAAAQQQDPLLAHLSALRALVPDIEGRLARADPGSSSIWRDLESARLLGADTGELQDALGELLGAYRAWHAEVRWEGGGRLRFACCAVYAACCCAAAAVRVVRMAAAYPAIRAPSSPLPSLPPLCPHTTRNNNKQRARAACANQEYVHRCLDSAEARAARAARHLKQQLQRLKSLEAALGDAAALPALLADVGAGVKALQTRCDALAAALPPSGAPAARPR